MEEGEIDVEAMSGQITQFINFAADYSDDYVRRYVCVGLAILAGAPTSSLVKVAADIYDFAHSDGAGGKSKPNLKQVK